MLPAALALPSLCAARQVPSTHEPSVLGMGVGSGGAAAVAGEEDDDEEAREAHAALLRGLATRLHVAGKQARDHRSAAHT